MTQLPAQLLAGRVQLPALAADAAGPGVLAQRVDHRTANAPFGERLELDAAIFVEAMGGIDEADHPILHEIPDVDRVRHRRGHASGKRLDKRQAIDDAAILAGGERLGVHDLSCWARKPFPSSRHCTLSQRRYQQQQSCSRPHHYRRNESRK